MASYRFRSLVLSTTALMLAGSCGLAPGALAQDAGGNAGTAKAAPASSNGPTSAFDEAQSRAFMLVMNSKEAEAQKLVEDAIKRNKNSARRIELYYLLSALEHMDDDNKAAISHLQLVLAAQPAVKTVADHLQRALILKRIGDCYYGDRNIPPALANYHAALLQSSALSPDNKLTGPLLEATAGTLVFAKRYVEAESTAKQWLQLTTDRAKSGLLEDVSDLFWARIQLLNIYRHLGKEAERKALAASSMPLLDQLLIMRAQLDAADKLPDLEKTKKEFEERYISAFHPASPADYLWLADEFRMRTLPLINWPFKNQTAKAIILCIHGLGLENRAFTPFGREMAERGYTVYALDVRGFGSWQSAQGQEDVQFTEAIKDIGTVLNMIKEREKGLPIFLLGESMGGAIALRGAAAYGNSLAGVISSVPSAERFQEKVMGFSVAYHLLKEGKDKPFRVGDMVTAKATDSKLISDKWKADSKAKMEMSPKELIKFSIFMRTTKGECSKITTPALVVQGLKDELVKPEGTEALFDAIKGTDKVLCIIGTAEHLMFETFHPDDFLMGILCAWMEKHNQVTRTNTGG